VSLVREALAKAEREAAARAARERGLPPGRADLAQPYRAPRRRRWPWAAGLVVAALAGAGVAYLLAGSRDAAPPDVSGRNEASPPTATSARPGDGHVSPAEPPVAAGSSSSVSPIDVAGSGEAEAQPPATAGSAVPIAAAAPMPAAATETDPAAPTGTHVREVALGGGRVLRLGGIAWSETAPVAYLNGRLRGVGEVVEGWEITAIARDRVALAAGARRVEITLR